MNYNLRSLNFKEILGKVKAFVFDVDGVLSRSVLNLDDSGEFIRTTNVKDGYILKYAKRKGFVIGIISGGNNENIIKRFHNLGIEDVIIKSKRKVADMEIFLEKYNLRYEDVLYMGDDIPDLEIMQKVGLPCCPNDAVTEIKEISVYISKLNGGEGCVRDIVEQVLRTHGKWMDNDSFET
ncbi:MAG: HAD hydrolase family protein [Bacteroidales bacterium]|jgi:3-deoxy-D-manno-octulosonate 8-phosphate phosphatase (KDO 8-P phosphatase)|nr:HAD hydrolase family protein [Bacteroidales bacterium]